MAHLRCNATNRRLLETSTLGVILKKLPTVLIVAAAMSTSSYMKPSYQEQYEQCRKTCLDKGMFGDLRQKPGPMTQQPSAIEYDCVCF